ncbi:tripartite motif-containing protein 44 [Chanos chanos]|uniref:Tripartite motif-containing protein 44 n=1 Tax=Chanos chanos TaxID=29144 RepID=A0A6J2URY6_CHACN|nr:tripartite motif-containing protein 44 [Chanos chanos]
MMNGPGACWEGQEDEDEDLPQMDGTCDACEPDEAQPAVQVCVTCRFAFCSVHADKHTRSTRHPLHLYCAPDPAPPPHTHREPVEGAEAQSGGAEGGSGEEEEDAEEGGKRDTVTVERLRCKEHGQEGALYCKTDEKIICVVCAVHGEHHQHDIITLREAYHWQKSKEGIDLLRCTQEMAERIKTKWTSPDMSKEELEVYVNQQFSELHRLVRLEERRTLHLVDLKEAFLTAQAAESIAEITVHTERLQEEMASITRQLGELDRVEREGVAAAASFGPPVPTPPDPAPRPELEPDVRPRLPEPRHDPRDPHDFGEGGSGSFMGHTP